MKLGLIGAGKMASALARGIGEPAIVADVDTDRARALAAELGGEAAGSNTELARAADVVVLCHKPAQLRDVAGEIAADTRAVASILGGTSLADLEAAYPGIPAYRFIPNIPAEVRRGVVCYAAGARASEGPEDELLDLFARVGTVVALEDGVMDAATAVMSCAPAWLALAAGSLAAAGSAHGLEPAQAALMVNETMAGTAAYLAENEIDFQALSDRVATPGGLTARGLDALEAGGMPDAFRAAVDVVVTR
jgi:pyrroline-5-carboxylate reductase